MHLPLILLTTSAAALATAQVIFNTTTYQFVCPSTLANGAYCTGPSLSSNIIVRCTGTVGQAGNCNDNLAAVPPLGVKEFAPCYASTPTAGDAACSYGGTVYPENGPSFPVPGPGNNNNTTPNTTPNSNSTFTSTPGPLNSTTATSNSSNASLSPTHSPLTALSTSTSVAYIFASSASSPAPALAGYTAALGDLGSLPSARYPIPSASNGTIVSSGTVGSAPSKTAGPGPKFTGGAGRTGGVVGVAFASLVAFGVVLVV